jgi:nitrogen fixation/metabolism regulation signal transduction histidine kinase
MPQGTSVTPGPAGRHQRRLKNYLLDTHFQFKYSGYLMLIAVVLSLGLGTMLWRTSNKVIDQSWKAVRQGEEVVARGKEVVAESQKVSAVVQMNIIKDPVYSDSPALLEAFKADAAQQDERLKAQQESLQRQATQLKQQAAELSTQQRNMLLTLCGALLLLVVLIGLAGIIVTHRVAGPIYKMKSNLKAVADGRLRVPTPLRKGDELVEFFETFRSMVIALRERQEAEIAKLDSAISVLEPKAGPAELEALHSLRRDMQGALEVQPSLRPSTSPQ